MFNNIKIRITKKSLIYLAVFVVLLAADLLTKFIEEKYNLNFTVIPNFIYVESGVRNSGASFSFLADAAWGQVFLKTITIIMIVILLVAFLFVPERFTVLKVALSMVLAGALGNLVDRFAFNEVRDFVWVNMLGNYACCNFADFWITFGVAVIIIDMLFLNEWAVFPLTKKAKLAQKQSKEKQAEKPSTVLQNSADTETSKPENLKTSETGKIPEVQPGEETARQDTGENKNDG